jgi:hypothetical protein
LGQLLETGDQLVMTGLGLGRHIDVVQLVDGAAGLRLRILE